jgi:hypothetical protein
VIFLKLAEKEDWTRTDVRPNRNMQDVLLYEELGRVYVLEQPAATVSTMTTWRSTVILLHLGPLSNPSNTSNHGLP